MADIISRLAHLSPEKQRLLALKLKLKGDAAAASAGRVGGGGERPSEFPASFAQRRMWLLDRLEPGSTAYSMPRVWRIPGPLDVAAMERAVDALVRRHETLRTHLEERGEELVQVVAPPAPFRLEVTDLSALAPGEARAELERLVDADASAPFRLEEGPLFRASLVRLSAGEHALLWNLHHAVTDGWSAGIVARELRALQQAFSRGEPSPLAPLPLQYGDHALRERERLSGDTLARLVGFWRGALEGAPTRLEIAPDRPRPAARTHRGAAVSASLDAGLSARVDALARARDATPFMVYLAAFQLLLGRYARQDDVLVGTAVANRATADVEGIVGFFVNTLVLRGDLSGDPTFAELLGRVREATLGAFEHQALPFEKLVEELNPERSLTHAPLVQAVIVLHNQHSVGGGLAATAPAPAQAAGSAPPLEAGAEEEAARFDLSLELTQGPDGVRARLGYATDLFERGTAERMLGHLARVLEQVVADADARLSRLELLDEAERARVLEAWNRTEAEYPADRCVHELFEAQAARTPGAVALVFEDGTLSYVELNARANRLARHLVRLGVGPETRVGICLERGPEMVLSVLAVLKAGGAYVPLDPAYPAERLAFVLSDAAVPVLVTRESLRAALPAGDGVAVVSVDGDAARIAAESAENLDRAVSPGHLAYVIHTSGSTGTPKGVMVPHRGVPNLAYAQAHRFGIDHTSRVLQFASLSFDAAAAEIFDTLLAGATLVLAPREALLPGAELLETLRSGRVTVATLPPSVLAVLPPDDLPELRTVISAGEAVDAATVARWSEGRVFVNAYGPTEVTVCATSAACEADGRIPAIGRPLENARVYVLDAVGGPAPVGVPGELCVGGVGVVRGYLGRPGLTAERFVPDPFGGEPGARLYRTGDRARWRADGELEFLGRLDEQVKVRGFRVEPGEIEAVLRGHGSVADCVVVAREDVPGDPRLVAYVVGGVEAEELRAHARRSLPEYMVPSAFVSLDALPLTPNGKVDRKALPAPDLASPEEKRVAPRTPAEEVLAEIWAETLRRERVGVTESFFELGGHSLLATRVVSRVRQVFGVEVPLRALFEGPTVAELAGRVEALRRAGAPALPPVVPAGRTGALPLSFAQERLWFIDRLEPGSAVYNMPTALRLTGALDERALERSLSEIVRRHEALRTVFAEVDGSPVQLIAPFGAFALPVEDLSDLNEAEREAAVGHRAREEARRPFDLSAGPLFRAVLLRLGDEDRVLLLSMHHVVSDAWSMGVLSRELWALYDAYREGRESPLAELPVQYADYAVWQREQLTGEVLDRQLAYWKERLAGAPELLELPTDHPRPAVQTYRGASVPVGLSLELLERLQALGRSEGATLYMTLLGAFQVLLSKYAGSEDVVVGSPIAGRTREEVEGLIGFFVNTLVLRTGLSGDPSFREVVKRVREATLGAYEHQEVPFEKLVAELSPERSLSHSPLFQVAFTLDNAQGTGGGLAGLGARGVGTELEVAKFDLSLSLTETPQGLRGGLTYSTDLFERGTIERMLGHLGRVLEQIAADADARLSRLELLGGAERALVLEAWNRTEAGYPAERCIHELFEAQAARTPGEVAVVFGEASLTYAELNERSGRLARALQRRGVGPEARVGVLMERGLELVVSLLAVLKAGGAYVPLDPAYPAERVAFMLADSAASVLLTQEKLRGHVAVGPGVHVVVEEEARAEIADPSAEGVESRAAPRNLAYLIYTSGSTGTPKGVAIEHESAVAMLAWAWSVYSGEELSGMLASTSISFDMSVFELFAPLTRGGRVIVVENALALPTSAAADQARLLDTVPSAAAALLKSGGIPSGVRTVNLGGEPLRAELVDALYAHGVERVYDLYGPSEDTTFSTYALREPGGPVTIGRVLSNSRAYVVDTGLRPVPVGVPGELYLGGRGVTRGYLGRPGLTAERYVPDPFGAEPGARMYRTGDRVRRKADGTLEYLGRLDHQVKVRGFRVETGEIEAVLRGHGGVSDCVVVAREEAGEQRLVAYVAGEVGAEALRAHVRRSLPEYMVPGAFVVLDRLPLTPNGKLDRGALPSPEPASGETGYVAPRRPLEAALAGIWAEVLGRARVGVQENFFDLGGHSLLLVKVQTRLRETLGREVSIVDLFRLPTVAALAEHLGGEAEGAGGQRAGAEGRRRRGRDRAAVRRALGGQGTGGTGAATLKEEDS